MRRSQFLITVLILVLWIRPAFGCFSTPQEQVVPDIELVQRTKTIVLAKVMKAELLDEDSLKVRYYFRAMKSLKGRSDEEFFIDGTSLAYSDALTTFDHHHSERFWKPGGGRSWHDTDCVIYPTFTVGGIFLIFLDEPYHRKSFELIIRTHGDHETRDKWLTWVEERTMGEQGVAPQSATRSESDSEVGDKPQPESEPRPR